MRNLKDLKRRIDIIEVLEKVGARTRVPDNWDDEVQVWCPFCDDIISRKPAARANQLKGLYFCYGCGSGGSVIDIAVEYLTQQVADQNAADGDEPDVFGAYEAPISAAVDWLEENWPAPEAEDDPWTS